MGTDDDSDFEVRGQFQGKAVRRCRKCGAGLLVGLFSGVWLGKPQTISPELWAKMDALWRQRMQ